MKKKEKEIGKLVKKKKKKKGKAQVELSPTYPNIGLHSAEYRFPEPMTLTAHGGNERNVNTSTRARAHAGDSHAT